MGELRGIVRFTFHADKVEEFKRLSAECLEIVRAKDVGTLQYDTYFNADESECIVLERFRDSDALILHSQNMAPFMESIMATGAVSGELLGDLSEELRDTDGRQPGRTVHPVPGALAVVPMHVGQAAWSRVTGVLWLRAPWGRWWL